jgi:hypothetical protein
MLRSKAHRGLAQSETCGHVIENVPEAEFRNNLQFARCQPPSGDECAAGGGELQLTPTRHIWNNLQCAAGRMNEGEEWAEALAIKFASDQTLAKAEPNHRVATYQQILKTM